MRPSNFSKIRTLFLSSKTLGNSLIEPKTMEKIKLMKPFQMQKKQFQTQRKKHLTFLLSLEPFLKAKLPMLRLKLKKLRKLLKMQ